MKKFFQIIGITIGSIIGLVIAIVSVAVWCVFTPERITPVVRTIADKYITCEWDLDEVELTFFSTFPEFGLKVTGLYLINPMPEAQSDTVLVAPGVVATIHVMEYLQHNKLVIRELSMPDLRANIYIDAQGQCNASVFYSTPDTTTTDTTAFSLPFDSIVVHRLAIDAQHLTFLDRKDSIEASLGQTNLQLNMAYWDDIRLKAELKVESLKAKGEEYAHDVTLSLDAPAELDLETMYIALHRAQLAVNEFALGIDGSLTLADSIPMNIRVQAQDWQIQPVLALLPKSITDGLKDIQADGYLSLDATAYGVYSQQQMPLIDANVQLKKGHGNYAALPYTIDQLALDADAHLDMNKKERSLVTIHQLKASTLDSEIQLKGTIRDLLGHMYTQAHLNVDAFLPDWAYFLPNNLQANGRLQGKLDIQATLDEIIAGHIQSAAANGDVLLQELTIQMDSMQAECADATIHLDAQLKDWPTIQAQVGLQSAKALHIQSDSLDATILAPVLTVQGTLNTQDTTHMPTMQASIQWNHLQGYFKDYQGDLGHSTLEVKTTNAGRRHSWPVCKATLSSHDIDTKAGNNHLTVKSVDLEAKALYNKQGANTLLKWNPVLNFFLNGAEADIDGLDKHVSVPQIIFAYSNRDFDIKSSSVLLGNSDFSLTGNIHHIGKWLMKKDMLTGELNFISNHTDVNELLALFSANSGSEETTTTTTTTTDTTKNGPFLVPNDVDLTLNTQIKEAEVMNQHLKNLGGKVYVKEGTLVLEEMGFVCEAAKLQLTAMYRTPRRNHIYLGLDYHMLDVKIDQLISMIPQIDSLVPMLAAFKGEAEFHLAGESYLTENYQLKTSTLRGACSIFGKDLVVMDSETFDKISKLLSFKKKTENKVDSISAEITLYKDEVDVYPFCVSIDNYMAAMGGRHNLDMSFDYHINLLSPIYVGVDVKGTPDNLSIKPAKCIYAKDFKPIIHKNVDTQNAELRQIIRTSLRKNVKIQ